MKLVLSYDLEDAIKNVREPFGPYKIVRNNRRLVLKVLPIYVGLDYLIQKDITNIPPVLLLQYAVYISVELAAGALIGQDYYYLKSYEDLHQLASQLKGLHLSTDYPFLRQAEVYEKKNRIHINENKIPSLLQEKYFLVPTYGFQGKIKNSSLLQEHDIGSKQYVLSIGSPKKEYQAAFAHV